jgi:hypothetical protein
MLRFREEFLAGRRSLDIVAISVTLMINVTQKKDTQRSDRALEPRFAFSRPVH